MNRILNQTFAAAALLLLSSCGPTAPPKTETELPAAKPDAEVATLAGSPTVVKLQVNSKGKVVGHTGCKNSGTEDCYVNGFKSLPNGQKNRWDVRIQWERTGNGSPVTVVFKDTGFCTKPKIVGPPGGGLGDVNNEDQTCWVKKNDVEKHYAYGIDGHDPEIIIEEGPQGPAPSAPAPVEPQGTKK